MRLRGAGRRRTVKVMTITLKKQYHKRRQGLVSEPDMHIELEAELSVRVIDRLVSDRQTGSLSRQRENLKI